MNTVLYGEFDLKIDAKNRMGIPAAVRQEIPKEYGEAFFLVIGINRVPWFYPERYYGEMVSKVPTEMTPGEDLLAFDQLYFAMASKLTPDDEGRVLIPGKILQRAQIGKEVTLIGVRDHLELWNRADWEVRREELFQRNQEIAARAKLARQAQPAV
jgi:MraZ protein